jgi:hypothetical protein
VAVKKILPPRLAVAMVTVFAVIPISGCLIESPRGDYSFQNNSQQTVALRLPVRGGPGADKDYIFTTTAAPGETVHVPTAFGPGQCFKDWEIVDTSGELLRKVERVCDKDTVVYP